MTSEEYLIARGWRIESRMELEGDYLIDPVSFNEWILVVRIDEAVAIQVQRDSDCAAFAGKHIGRQQAAEFHRVFGGKDEP